MSGGLGGLIGGLPLVGSLLGGLGGQTGTNTSNGIGQMPNTGVNYPGYGPGAWPGWPVPSATVPLPKQQFQGDFSKAGPGEQYFSDNKGAFTQPGQGQGYWDKNAPQFQQGGPADQYWNGVMGSGQSNPPKSTNYAADAYQNVNNSQPADMSPYYQNAQRQAAEQINAQYAARGMGRSSGALDQNAEAATNLAAQEAKDNAQYGLQRGGLLGNLAASADQSSRGNNQNQLGWLTGMGNLGLGVQSADLQRLMGGANIAQGLDSNSLAHLAAGMTAGLGAQNAMENRGQNFFTNNLMFGKATADPMQAIYTNMLGGDRGLQESQMQMALGVPREALNQDIMNQQMALQNQAAQQASGGGGLGGLLGGGGGGMGGLLGLAALL